MSSSYVTVEKNHTVIALHAIARRHPPVSGPHHFHFTSCDAIIDDLSVYILILTLLFPILSFKTTECPFIGIEWVNELNRAM